MTTASTQALGELPKVAGTPIEATRYRGNDKLLAGIILGVITFWLFAQTTLNVAPDMQKDLGLDTSLMNTAVAITALFSGIFIVVIGGLADHVGRVKVMKIGFLLSIAGSLFIALAPGGALASYFLFPGRALQGLSAACIMPSSLALVKTFWEGAARQRAISMWSIGSWGGSGVCSLFGGFVAQNYGWRTIFFINSAPSAIMVAALGYSLEKAPIQISREAGGTFILFGGIIVGRHIELVPDPRIVQAWRVAYWDPGVYSIAKFELAEQGAGTKIIFDHTGFPQGQAEHLVAGWKAHYWEPLEKFLA